MNAVARHDVTVRSVSVGYGGRQALHDVACELPAGAMTAIVGPNGAGKSTLLKAVAGLVPLAAGEVLVDGRPLGEARSCIAYVPQREAVDWDFPVTVREVVQMGRYPDRRWLRRLRRDDHDAVSAALDRVGMAELGGRPIGALSGGQQQRTFLARALAQQRPVLLLDEPFAGIDARTQLAMLDVLRSLADAGATVVVVHHELLAVREAFDRVVLLNGAIIATGPPDVALDDDALARAYGVLPLRHAASSRRAGEAPPP